MTIERMSEKDIEDVTKLSEQLGYPNKVSDIKARYIEIKDLSDYSLYVARNSEGKVLGFVQVHAEALSLLEGSRANLGALIVDQRARGKGVGAALIKKAEEWARERGLHMMRVRTNIKRIEAHQFYEKQGYEINKTSHILTKKLL